MIRHLPKLLPILLCVTLLWAPLPFGSVTRGAAAALEISAFLALFLAALTVQDREVLRRALVPAASLFAIALFGWLQSLPVPGFLAGLLSPGHAALFGDAQAHLSVAPEVSRRVALGWAAVAAALVAASVAGHWRWARRALAGSVLAAAFFQVLYGAPRWLSNAGTIWGLAVPGMRHRLRGTFVNPDHLATYLALALPLLFAWVWWAVSHARDTPEAERKVLLVAPPVILWLVLFSALAFTGSRAGLVAVMAGVVVQSLLLRGGGRRSTGVLLGGGALLAGLGVVAFLGLREGFGRLLSTSAYEVTWSARLEAYASSLALWRHFPVLGSGLGTFRDAFPAFQPETLPGVWRHAHSDWLELFVTTGVVGPVLLALGLFALTRSLLKTSRRAVRSEDRAAALAALGALAAAGTHELLDFGLTMPANALTLAVICGAALAAGRSHRSASRRSVPGATVPPVSGSTSIR
ncbi:MAG: O-antigen ligase family protein [Acidobacteria bacterium]|nr:O-antigen ligase family protein [Acidobacteriota bacterium]